MERNDFNKLFIDELSDIYNAEQQLVQALPKLVAASSSPKLKEAFTNHLRETKNQVLRLETIFNNIEETAESVTCLAMQGLIEESAESINNYPVSAIRDAAIIAAAQRIEHYEIAVYGVLRTFAKEMGLKDIAKILQESLDEVARADKTLTTIAEGGIFVGCDKLSMSA